MATDGPRSPGAGTPHPRRSYVDTLQVAGRLAATLPAIDAVAALTDYYDVVAREAIAQAEATLGRAPCRYSWLALGSHARRELSLSSDQDNALVLENDSAEAHAYGQGLAASVIQALDDAGLRPCDGGYMADAWCFSLTTWEQRLEAMLADPSPAEVVDADVLLDMRPVAGALDISRLGDVMLDAARSERLLHGLAGAAVTFPSAMTQFGRVRLVHGAFDAKRGGLAPLVMLARLYGLEAHRLAPSTVERLALAAGAQVLSDEGVRALLAAHELLTQLRLDQQLHDAERAQPISDRVQRDRLSATDLSELHRALRAITRAQQVTALRFRTTQTT